jgi:hypothetical protein
LHVLAGEGGVFGQDIFDGIAAYEELEDGLHGDAGAADDGATVADIGIKRDALGHGRKVARLPGNQGTKGRRARGNGARSQFGAQRHGDADYLDGCRQKRNIAGYDYAVGTTKQNAGELI